jgi:hypothetical protein
LKKVKRHPPLSGVRYTGYAECVCAANVADDGFMVGECNDMAGGNDVVYAYDSCAAPPIAGRIRCGISLRQVPSPCCRIGWRFLVRWGGYSIPTRGVVVSRRLGAVVIMAPL